MVLGCGVQDSGGVRVYGLGFRILVVLGFRF